MMAVVLLLAALAAAGSWWLLRAQGHPQSRYLPRRSELFLSMNWPSLARSRFFQAAKDAPGLRLVERVRVFAQNAGLGNRDIERVTAGGSADGGNLVVVYRLTRSGPTGKDRRQVELQGPAQDGRPLRNGPRHPRLLRWHIGARVPRTAGDRQWRSGTGPRGVAGAVCGDRRPVGGTPGNRGFLDDLPGDVRRRSRAVAGLFPAGVRGPGRHRGRHRHELHVRLDASSFGGHSRSGILRPSRN